MFGRGLIFERDAGDAIEFAHGFLQHHRPARFGGNRVHALQIQRGVDALGPQLHTNAGADAPHLTHFGGLQQGSEFLRTARAQVADLRVLRGVAAGFAFGAFGDGVGQFGQGLGGADADAGRDADPLEDAPADGAGAPDQITGDAAQVDEAFVDGIDLLRVAQACGQAHHAVAHVAIQRKVGRQGHKPGLLLQVADLEPGRTHLDAQRFGLVRAGNGAAVVVGKDDERAVLQPGLEDAFAAAVEVVAVDEGEHGEGHGQILYK